MTFQEKVERAGAAHKGVIPNVWHYYRPQLTPPYAIWQEDGQGEYYANNKAAEISVTGTTDYFTKAEFDKAVDDIQAMFAENGFLWRLESVQYEPETNLIHYEWSWEML